MCVLCVLYVREKECIYVWVCVCEGECALCVFCMCVRKSVYVYVCVCLREGECALRVFCMCVRKRVYVCGSVCVCLCEGECVRFVCFVCALYLCTCVSNRTQLESISFWDTRPFTA